MPGDIEHIKKQIEELEHNLWLIEERKTEYADPTTIPIDLIKVEKKHQTRLEELRRRLEEALTNPTAGMPDDLKTLFDDIVNNKDSVVLTDDRAAAIKDHKPVNLTEYRLVRIAEWSLPNYQIDNRFVNLTLLLDQGEQEPQRWLRAEDFRHNDLREVLKKTEDRPALVLLGSPGCGKSTLLRRLQLDHSIDQLREGKEQVSFFIQLNRYRAGQNGILPEPREWLNARWKDLYPQLPELETYLQNGDALLLLDALNEMPHKKNDYPGLVGLWREFTEEAAGRGNRIVFSCRSLDYSSPLSSKDLRVPQVEVQPLNPDQMRDFIKAYAPVQESFIWGKLHGSPQFTVFQTPYFLKLLCEQVESTRKMPEGPAGLFTGLVRQSLAREINGELLQIDEFLDEMDRTKLSNSRWRNPFDLPDHGILIPKLSDLAFKMQEKGLGAEGAQVRIDYDDACNLVNHQSDKEIIKAGVALNVLDVDLRQYDLAFFHQLLQEYFAARCLAKDPNPGLVYVEWAVGKVSQKLEDTLSGLADGDPLPPLPQTGWEETTLTAAPMARDPEAFIRNLIPHNLPLAARCAASPELTISSALKREIQNALIIRTQDMQVDLRARITAGEALGTIDDPRFELCEGPNGKFLMPPMVEIPGGTYPIGDNKSDYSFEKPAHTVDLESFQIGKFPVTNAEYAMFLNAGGYEDKQWWDTPESIRWLNEGGSEGSKQGWRDFRKALKDWSEDGLRDLVSQNKATTEQFENWIEKRNWTDERFEQWLDEMFPAGKLYRQPEYWNDTRFNNPAQPVVGITWFEASAYCKWLTANSHGVPPSGGTESIFRLPTEAEFEVAARGKKGRMFPYSNDFDVTRCNTFESHIRRSTPVGIFDNATPEGVFDLSGNVYTWTSSIYDQKRFPYPYKTDDGREDVEASEVSRVLRGGSWDDSHVFARAVCRSFNSPNFRDGSVGFRVVGVVRPPSQ